MIDKICRNIRNKYLSVINFTNVHLLFSELQVKKEEKPSKEVKPKSPQPQIKKEAKPEQGIVKPEKTVSHGKPEEKVLKQVKAVTTEKMVKPKPAKKAEHQEKEAPSLKIDKPKPTSKVTSEVTDSGKKKTEKPEMESKVSTRKESPQLHNVTKAEKPARVSKEDFEDVPAPKKAKEETEDVSSTKKQKSPISFFQCVYLDGYNGYGFQFPVTPARHPGESSGHGNSPGQKQGQ
nr:triadin-like [Microcebus murinus]